MENNWTQKEIWSAVSRCKRQAMVDPAFRAKMLTDPAAAIRDLTGKEVPADVKFQVLERDPKANMAIVLPPVLPTDLSDDDLDKVSAAKSSDTGMCS